MSVNSTTNRASWTADGIATQFSFGYLFLEDADLSVYVTDLSGVITLKTLTTDYTVTGSGTTTGYITFGAAPTNLYTVTIVRAMPNTQEFALENNGALDVLGLICTFDRLTLSVQKNVDTINRSVFLCNGYTPQCGWSGGFVPVANAVFAVTCDCRGVCMGPTVDTITTASACAAASAACAAVSASCAGVSATCAGVSASCATLSSSCASLSSSCALLSKNCASTSSSCASLSSSCASLSSSCASLSASCANVSATCANVSSTCALLSSNCASTSSSCALLSSNCASTSSSCASLSSSCASVSAGCAGVSATCAGVSATCANVSSTCALLSSNCASTSSSCASLSSSCALLSSNCASLSSSCANLSSGCASVSASCASVSASCAGVSSSCAAAVFNAQSLPNLLCAASLCKVGTIATGVWNGTCIGVAYGGTGATTASGGFNNLSPLTTAGDTLYGGTSGAGTRLAGVTAATRNWYSSCGTGSAANAPAWATIAASDLSGITNTQLSGSAAISNANLASMTNCTVKGNISGGSATPSDVALASANTNSSVVFRDGSGNFSAGTITASLTGTASGNLTYSANQYGVVVSGSANAASVIAPNASTAFPLVSGGASANPSWALLTAAGGGTGVSSVTTSPTASSFAGWDASSNLSANNLVSAYRTTATAAGTTTLVVGDAGLQYFSGSTTQNIVLPNCTTLPRTGFQFYIVNLSTGTLTVKDAGSNTLNTIAGGGNALVTALSIGTSNGSWDFQIATSNAGGGTVTSVTFTGDGTVLSSTPSTAVTSSGTVTATLNTQTANKVFAGPTSGGAAGPTFRSLVAADILPIDLASTSNGGITGTLATGHGGTGVASVTTSPTASSFAGWDANKNLSANSLINGYRTTATAAGTLTLVVGDTNLQYLTGSTTHTVKMPVTSTLVAGQQYTVVNLSSGIVTVQSSGANTIQAMAANTQLVLTVIDTAVTTAAGWNSVYSTISGSVLATMLPNPSSSTLGGIQSYAAVSNQWINAISTSGVPASTQPAFTNISGTITRAQTAQGSVAALGYRSVTGNDTASNTTDDVLILSSTSFTETLPTAVGNAGKVFTLIHNGTSITNIYTLNTTSSQTIGGVASGSYKLYTAGERLQVISDGTNWQILNHNAITDWVDGGAVTITGTTSNPTKASGVTSDHFYWRRDGKEISIRYDYRQSNTTSAAAGSGDYLFALVPSGLTIDSTALTFYTTAAGVLPTNVVGKFYGSNSIQGSVFAHSTTQVRFGYIDTTAAGIIGSGKYPLTTAGLGYQATLFVPITEWQT